MTAGQKIIIGGTDYDRNLSGIDSSTNAIITIDSVHHEIHEGDHFYIQGYVELDDEDDFYLKLVTPPGLKLAHFIFAINSTGITETFLDEDADGGMAGGSAITPLNSDRNSSNTSVITLTGDVAANVSYTTRLEHDKWGADGFKESIGGGTAREDELILKADTIYCRGIISHSNNNLIQFKASWYEHTDSN